ncbi:hypothetical protein RJ640_008840 [Escallonia rubra]|uniref:Uncharacterized protein n=1 Tax=Escallonia rubra TaxID=112253 RepID=A0AA88UWK1_9ASTE|nr:hypothetical protein RJ640_008840 [Escallonia rubra]
MVIGVGLRRWLKVEGGRSMVTYSAGHKNWVLCIAWSPDGKHLVSGSKSGELQCWDPQTGKASGNPLIHLLFSPFPGIPNP